MRSNLETISQKFPLGSGAVAATASAGATCRERRRTRRLVKRSSISCLNASSRSPLRSTRTAASENSGGFTNIFSGVFVGARAVRTSAFLRLTEAHEQSAAQMRHTAKRDRTRQDFIALKAEKSICMNKQDLRVSANNLESIVL